MKEHKQRDYTPWRVGTLILVYVLMVAHVVHWKLAGRTLAPLELNEVMYTLELGIVTAGFIFMALLVVLTMIFGRFFCSWACHILALEDLACWILGKMGIKPKQVRSRLLMWVPMGAMLYMFVWPQVLRLWQGRDLPRLHIEGDGSAWSSFLTSDYTRNLPGPWVTALTFFVCGFAVIYLLGARTFCRYSCPYGAIFGLADRVAPGRLIKTSDCDACSLCTAACQSDIAVHKELQAYGTVVNPACLKDLDCISACPGGAIGFGFTKPSLFRKRSKERKMAQRYDYSWPEELWLAGLFLFALAVCRGLYGWFPFLLSLTVSGMFAFIAVHTWRMLKQPAVRFGKVQLKLSGKLKPAGQAFAACTLISTLFMVHSGYVHFHVQRGERMMEHMSSKGQASPEEVARATNHLLNASGAALMDWPGLDQKLAYLLSQGPDPAASEEPLRRLLERDASNVEARSQLVSLFESLNQPEKVDQELRAMLAAADDAPDPKLALCEAYEMQGLALARRGDMQQSLGAFQRALEVHPESASAYRSLGDMLAGAGQVQGAIDSYTESLKLDSKSAVTHFNLAVMLSNANQVGLAVDHYLSAIELSPADPEIRSNLGFLYLSHQRIDEAEVQLSKALELDAGFAPAHFNLGRLRHGQGRMEAARMHLEAAARLDARFAEGLKLLEQTQ